jgi:hypothetical protein
MAVFRITDKRYRRNCTNSYRKGGGEIIEWRVAVVGWGVGQTHRTLNCCGFLVDWTPFWNTSTKSGNNFDKNHGRGKGWVQTSYPRKTRIATLAMDC